MSNTTRPDGFYWVKFCGEWTVGEWYGEWQLAVIPDCVVKDSNLDEIGERIVRRAGPECPRCGGAVLAITDAHECGGEEESHG